MVGRSAGAAAGIVAATVLLFLVSWIVEPQSLSHSSLLGMLPFAGVLAIAAMGQTLVVQQGGIDLSVPGMISLTVVLLTSYPNGDSGKLATYTIVGSTEADPSANRLSNESPVGKALLGHKKGDNVSVQLPNGKTRELKITKIDVA